MITFSKEKIEIKPHYIKTLGQISHLEEMKIDDPISDDPVNKSILKAYAGKKILGYIREISTTTGCNSACLPVIYTSFYDEKGQFKKIVSVDGLTKINHTPFTEEDYRNLEFFMVVPPKKFDMVKHPKEMTDAISGATIKKFQDSVVKGAAYSTLRIHLYNQHTMSFLQKRLKK